MVTNNPMARGGVQSCLRWRNERAGWGSCAENRVGSEVVQAVEQTPCQFIMVDFWVGLVLLVEAS